MSSQSMCINETDDIFYLSSSSLLWQILHIIDGSARTEADNLDTFDNVFSISLVLTTADKTFAVHVKEIIKFALSKIMKFKLSFKLLVN